MHYTTNVIVTAIYKAARFLQRDFFELEMLQTSVKPTIDFCDKSRTRVVDEMLSELEKKFPLIVLTDRQNFDISESSVDTILLINPIDGFENLSRSIPFFGISATCLKKQSDGIFEPSCCVIYFPVLNELFYAEDGGGSWVEKTSGNRKQETNNAGTRLRVSKLEDISSAFVAYDDQNIQFSNSTIRSFGSVCYDLSLLAAGKLDIVLFDRLEHYYIAQLLIKEAGGSVLSKSNGFIATNFHLAEKVSRIFETNE